MVRPIHRRAKVKTDPKQTKEGDSLELFDVDEETFQALLDVLGATEEERIEWLMDRKTRFPQRIN